MAVRVHCTNPSALLDEIRTAIQVGKVETWVLDSDGDLTHAPDQWRDKAWFRPSVEADRVVFHILGQKSVKMSRTVYGVYHGRLIEMLVTHFDLKFSSATATALAVAGDRVGPN